MGLGGWFRKAAAAVTGGDVKDEGESVNVPLWFQRLKAGQELCNMEQPIWRKLEDACDGLYPGVMGGAIDDASLAGTPYSNRFRSGDQLDINLIGRALQKKVGEAYDGDPTLEFVVPPSDDVDVVEALEDLADKLMAEGKAAYECRRGMESAHTRGTTCVFPMFIRDQVMEEEIVAAKIQPGEFVDAAMHLLPPKIPLGADYAGIAKALSEALNPVDANGNDSPFYYSLTQEQKDSLLMWQLKAEKAVRKAGRAPHSVKPRAKIHYECTPIGTWLVPDASVTDRSRINFLARKIVMTRDEFRASPTFTQDAKDHVVPLPMPSGQGGFPAGTKTASISGSDGRVSDEYGRIVVWEIWDKVGWRRIYLAQGYDKPVGKTTAYPYMDVFGRPLFPDFFPCSWRTPWVRMRESTARILGRPGLEPMWGPQIEYIKTISAYVVACKSTARIFLVGPGVDQKSLTKVAEAQDCAFVTLNETAYTPATMGDPSKQFVPMPMGQAPLDYLNAAEKVKHEAYESVGLSFGNMVSSPQAPTATQENLIAQGAASMAAAETEVFEDHYAELAMKSLLMFLEFASQEEFQAYVGEAALQPRKGTGEPTLDQASGQMVPPPDRPSIYEAMQNVDLLGSKLRARFAASSRRQDMARTRTLEDILMTVDQIRDSTGAPYIDPRDILRTLLKAADVRARDYQPSESEISMKVAAMMSQQQMGAGGPPPPGGKPPQNGQPTDKHDWRRAGDQRGAPSSPGAQTRGREALSGPSGGGQAKHLQGIAR